MQNRKLKNMKNKSTLHATLGPVCFATLLALGMVQPTHAAITADTSAANQPGIHTGAGGATIVDINKASDQGVSHNIYSEFNVDKNGVVLNNSTTNTNTQLAGNINGNSNLAGQSATIILNEVRSSDPSQLNGMVEVAGKSAQVIIANPSGITCDGCGFINTSRATLTTGTPTVDENGKLTGLDVKRGQVEITGNGMNTSNAGMPIYTDIIARSVKINAGLQAKTLNIVTGKNHLDKDGTLTQIEGEGDAPALALDVSTLGSMYVGKINMIGTESGVGVRLDHADLTATDDIAISVDGKLDNNGGRIQAGHNIILDSASLNNENSVIQAHDTLNISTQGEFNNKNGSVAGNAVTIRSDALNNQDGYITSQGRMSLVGSELNNVRGNIHSGDDMSMSYSYDYHTKTTINTIDNNQGNIVSNGDLYVQSSVINNDAGLIKTDGQLSLNAGTLNNSNSAQFKGDNNQKGGIYAGGVLRPTNDTHSPYINNTSYVHADTLNNDDGIIRSSGDGVALDVSGSNTMTNKGGVIGSASDLSINYGSQVNNTAGIIESTGNMALTAGKYIADTTGVVNAGHNLDLMMSSGFDNAGLIQAANDLNFGFIKSHQPVNVTFTNKGKMRADGQVTMNLQGVNFINEGNVYGNKGINWYGQDVTNKGQINSNGDIYFGVNTLTNEKSAVIKGNSVKISAASVKNEGTITPDYTPVQPDNGGSSGGGSHTPSNDDGSHTPISHH
ncbi:filamentous hemagglutinin N-terminal domain-containing protein [Atlantibacter sp.]|uniref:filamentous hemagglutinin N-terminal domain-containing protein n=1 Tax=Atlantibacter sp. TaxID=1903473 RepID=UPI0028B0982C|nr:filamentous hemagglutinin N-terminal domain-containing protein [Atlantibacter sp.]